MIVVVVFPVPEDLLLLLLLLSVPFLIDFAVHLLITNPLIITVFPVVQLFVDLPPLARTAAGLPRTNTSAPRELPKQTRPVPDLVAAQVFLLHSSRVRVEQEHRHHRHPARSDEGVDHVAEDGPGKAGEQELGRDVLDGRLEEAVVVGEDDVWGVAVEEDVRDERRRRG